MIEQLSTALVGMAFFQNTSGVGVAGLTVTFDIDRIVNNAGTPTITNIVTGGSATDLGKGYYGAPISAVQAATEGEYLVLFKTADTSVQARELPSLWSVGVSGVENLDLAISAVDLDVWDQPVPGAFAAGTAGFILGTNLDAPVSSGGGGGGGDIVGDITITANGINYRPYGGVESVSLGAGVHTLNASSLATAIMVQAIGNDIYLTNDEIDPTATHGFQIIAGMTWQILPLRDSTHDILKFLRAGDPATLVYQYLRPQ